MENKQEGQKTKEFSVAYQKMEDADKERVASAAMNLLNAQRAVKAEDNLPRGNKDSPKQMIPH